jgi:hypothetical protein
MMRAVRVVLDPSIRPALQPAAIPDRGAFEDRYSPVDPAARRSDPTASAIRVMILENASQKADALADYWIAVGSGEEHATLARSADMSSLGGVLAAAFACYVARGGDPVRYIRAQVSTFDEERGEAVRGTVRAAADKLASMLADEPAMAEAWTPPDHEQD